MGSRTLWFACVCAGFLAAVQLVAADSSETPSQPPSSWWPFSTGLSAVNKELLDAAQAGDLDRVRSAVERGANVDVEDHVRDTFVRLGRMIARTVDENVP